MKQKKLVAAGYCVYGGLMLPSQRRTLTWRVGGSCRFAKTVGLLFAAWTEKANRERKTPSAWTFFLNINCFNVMCEVGAHKSRAKTAAMGSLNSKRNDWEVCSVHGPALRTALPGCIFYFLLFLRNGTFPPEQKGFNVSLRAPWSRPTSSRKRPRNADKGANLQRSETAVSINRCSNCMVRSCRWSRFRFLSSPKKCENPSLEMSCRNMFKPEDVWKRLKTPLTCIHPPLPIKHTV